jgi:hypothetical protein
MNALEAAGVPNDDVAHASDWKRASQEPVVRKL